jgi:hypothetical protein
MILGFNSTNALRAFSTKYAASVYTQIYSSFNGTLIYKLRTNGYGFGQYWSRFEVTCE